jgi:hypothetical protein
MTVPSKADIDKRKKALEGFKKKLDSDGKASEKALCSAIRSAIRGVWMKHETKLAYLYERTVPDMNPNTRTKWLIQCECCGEMFKLGDVEINHKRGENQLLSFEDVLPFTKSILGVGFNDIEVLCKDCHSIQTYSERYGVSLEEAKLEKYVIQKINQTVAIQKKELLAYGYKASEVSNEEKRRDAYRQILKETK